MTFQELGLSNELLMAIEEAGYVHPMPVQEAVIPELLTQDHDVVALAQTGTGKTAAYGLPVLQRIAELKTAESGAESEWRALRAAALTRAVILAPTRELCLQITDDLEGFGKYLPEVKLLAVYGGANIEPQIRALKHGVDIIVATPGRLIDLINRGAARLNDVRYVALDEADEMLSMGFQEDLDTILETVPEDHRTLLFSATMSREIERIAKNYLTEAKTIQVGSRNEGAENVNHIYYMVNAKDKYLALKRVVDYYPKIYAIIFCRTRMETQEVADNLIRDGYNADALHGELSQQQRDLTMQKFRQHRTQLLVATDVAARGLDVDELTHVINYGMPDDTENYTHRSGRTGRAGRKGTSICIVHLRERGKIRMVEKTIGKDFERGKLPSGKEICAKQLYRVIDDIEHEEVLDEEIQDFLPEVQRRWEWLDKDDLIKRILSREFGRFLQYYANAAEIEEVGTKSKDGDKLSEKGKKGKRQKGDGPEAGYTRLFLTIGKMDGFYAREIIRLVNDHVRGKVEIGRIDLMKNYSFVEVPEEDAARVIDGVKGVRIKGRILDIEAAEPRQSSSRTAKGKGSDETNKRNKRAQQNEDGKHSKRAQQDDDGKRQQKPSREERGYTESRGRIYKKEDWMQFLTPGKKSKKENAKREHPAPDGLNGEEPDFSEEGWARRYPKKFD
ncbi:MAG: DEAD/DEAH box helicase [Bacteroidales bacterium]|nr:DEAD/DEAH box helicase [Candidatus Physcousia equi]